MALDYSAPWGKLLWGFTIMGTLVLGGVPLTMLNNPEVPEGMRMLVFACCTGTLLACALFVVRSYRLDGETLHIRRLLWTTTVPLTGLRSVRHSRDLIKGSIRVGNGGLFVFAGWFWSRQHGWFHLAGNDILGRAVLLELPDRKWMITPEDPVAFVSAVKKIIAA